MEPRDQSPGYVETPRKQGLQTGLTRRPIPARAVQKEGRSGFEPPLVEFESRYAPT